jgi:hypothetical protein
MVSEFSVTGEVKIDCDIETILGPPPTQWVAGSHSIGRKHGTVSPVERDHALEQSAGGVGVHHPARRRCSVTEPRNPSAGRTWPGRVASSAPRNNAPVPLQSQPVERVRALLGARMWCVELASRRELSHGFSLGGWPGWTMSEAFDPCGRSGGNLRGRRSKAGVAWAL